MQLAVLAAALFTIANSILEMASDIITPLCSEVVGCICRTLKRTAEKAREVKQQAADLAAEQVHAMEQIELAAMEQIELAAEQMEQIELVEGGIQNFFCETTEIGVEKKAQQMQT
jgi:hypothetical protein